MKKRKVIFFIEDLKLGGIETSFINTLKKLDLNKLDITILLEHKRGVFLDEIPQNIRVIDYNLSTCKFVPLRKIINRSKYIWRSIVNYHKYDIAINETPYSYILTNLSLRYGKKSYLWVHFNYTERWNKERYLAFFKEFKFKKYDRLIFVSQRALEQYQELHLGEQEQMFCYNLIPEDKNIKVKKIKKPENKFIFLNVSRHLEETKRITRIIEASKILSQKYNNFELWLVGDGVDHEKYQEMIKDYKLENIIKMFGFQKDPAPFYEASDAVILSSDYEGFPVVYCECMKFQKHLITTDLSDEKYLFDDTQLTLAKKDINDIALKMEYVMNKHIKVNRFDIDKFNDDIIKKYQNIFYE